MEPNARQTQAASATEGSHIVVAGPGTGKTHTLASRIARLLETGAAPGSILAVTFTRSAAQEMRERLKRLLPQERASQAAEVWIDTFHAVALRLLREGEHPFGPGVEPSIASEEDKAALLSGLVSKKDAAALLKEVRLAKQSLRPLEDGPAAEYQRRLEAARLLDFDDLLVRACELIDARPDFRERTRRGLSHILVDEFQDTSLAQYELMSRLAGANACVIGDPDQAIYSFSEGSFDPFARFRRERPDCRILSLSENYRSKASIVEAAKGVIRRSPSPLPRELVARMEKGLPLEVSPHATERQEAEMIARRIEGLLGGASRFTVDTSWAEKESESLSYGLNDIAVLYRFHAQAARIEEALDRAGLPYTAYGKVSESADQQDFRFREDAAPSSFLPRREAVSLMTLHRSKGQEFPVVFIAGCEEGVLPFDGSSLEEERRLFYVGMTRAKSRLFLSCARKRFLFGRALEGGPSRFISDIEETLRLLRESAPPRKKPAKARSQPSLFEL